MPAAPRALPAEATPSPSADATSDAQQPHFTVELKGDQVTDFLDDLRREVQYWLNQGVYTKVRIKRGGKQLLPDIPVAALLAIEAATFFWSGLLRGLLVNVAGKALFEVELVNDAKELLAQGRAALLRGDLDEALGAMQQAAAIDPRDAEVQLAMGSLHKARGEQVQARVRFMRALELDAKGDLGKQAAEQLEKLERKGS